MRSRDATPTLLACQAKCCLRRRNEDRTFVDDFDLVGAALSITKAAGGFDESGARTVLKGVGRSGDLDFAIERNLPNSLEGVTYDPALSVELRGIANFLPCASAALAKMAASGFDSIGTRFEHSSDLCIRHTFAQSKLRELDEVSGYAALNERHAAILEMAHPVAATRQAANPQLNHVIRQ